MELLALDYVVIIVAELDAALHFYVDILGLPLKHRSGGFAQLETGATRLALYTREAMALTLGKTLQAPAAGAPGFELGFKVTDVDAVYAELLAKGVTHVMPPTTRTWGQRTAYVQDPDGHLVELVQQLARP